MTRLSILSSEYAAFREFSELLRVAEIAYEKAAERSRACLSRVDDLAKALDLSKANLASQQEETRRLFRALQSMKALAPQKTNDILTNSFERNAQADFPQLTNVLQSSQELVNPTCVRDTGAPKAKALEDSIVLPTAPFPVQEETDCDLVLSPSPYTPSGFGAYKSCLRGLRS